MEKLNKIIRIAQKAILYNGEGKILAIRRSKTAPSRPLSWDLPGGGLEFGENTRDGIIREIKEETGMDISNLTVFDALSAVDGNGEFWVTICYTAKPLSEEVILSYEHDEFRWVTPQEFQELTASPRNKKFVEFFEAKGKNMI